MPVGPLKEVLAPGPRLVNSAHGLGRRRIDERCLRWPLCQGKLRHGLPNQLRSRLPPHPRQSLIPRIYFLIQMKSHHFLMSQHLSLAQPSQFRIPPNHTELISRVAFFRTKAALDFLLGQPRAGRCKNSEVACSPVRGFERPLRLCRRSGDQSFSLMRPNNEELSIVMMCDSLSEPMSACLKRRTESHLKLTKRRK